MWVRSEYANELAVLSTWLALLVPWNVSQVTRTDTLSLFGGLYESDVESSIFFLRFPFAEFQFRNPGEVDSEELPVENASGDIGQTDASGVLDASYAGWDLVGSVHVTTPPSSLAFYDGTLWQVSLLWALAAAVFGVAVLLSLGLYFREEAVTDLLPVSPVRVTGGLLGLYALGVAGASYLQYTQRDVVGFPIPAGVLVVAVLALILLRTESADPEDTSQG